MIGFIRKFLKDRRGNALVIMGAALPMVVGAAGLATDTIQWTLWKRQLQRAADSAAIAAAYDLQAAKGAQTTVAATVDHDLDLNLHTRMDIKTGYPKITYPANVGAATNTVQVQLAVQQRLPFSSMFMSTPPTIIATARAAAVPAGGSACFHALETGSTTGLNFTGNAAIEAPDCDGFSNAGGTNTSVAKGSSEIHLNTIGGVGGIQESNNFHVTAYRPYSPSMDDPFAEVNPDPSDMHCAETSTNTYTTVVVVDSPEEGHWTNQGKKKIWVVDKPAVTHTEQVLSTTYTPAALTDGVDITTMRDRYGNQANCFTALSVGSMTSLTIPASYTGPIYINGGDANIQGNLSCSECAIVLTNKDAASPIGTIKVNASANINITPPTSGTFKGIAIYQDRRATDCKNCNKVNGNSGSIIEGAIYFPSQELEYNGTGNTLAQCTMFVARRLNFSGNSGTSNKFNSLDKCAKYGMPNPNTQVMIRLIA